MPEAFMDAIPPNKLTKFAEMLRGFKEAINLEDIPAGGRHMQFRPAGSEVPTVDIPIGELLLGQAPEVLEDASYGFMPWSGKGQTFTLDPEAADVAMLPTFGALGLAKQAPKLLRQGLSRATMKGAGKEVADDVADIPGRRKFIKGLGAAATVATIPDLLRKVAPKATVKAATRAAVPTAAAKKIVMSSLGENMMGFSVPRGVLAKIEKELGDTAYDELDTFLKKLDWDEAVPGYERKLMSDSGYENMTQEFDEVLMKKGYGQNADPKVVAKRDKASEALYELSDEEVGNWVISGKPPKRFEEAGHLPYIHEEDIMFRVDRIKSLSLNDGNKAMDAIERTPSFREFTLDPVNNEANVALHSQNYFDRIDFSDQLRKSGTDVEGMTVAEFDRLIEAAK